MGLTIAEAPPEVDATVDAGDDPPAAEPAPATRRIVELRIALVAALSAILALAAGDIFDRRIVVLVPAALLPPGAALLLARRGPVVRSLGAIVAVAGALAITVTASGGGLADALDAVTSGPQRMLSTEWPSPDRVDFVGATAVLLALLAATAAELARHRRWHLVPLVPIVLAYGGIVGLSAPGGARPAWLLPLGLVATGLATLRVDRTGDDQLALLRGERRLIPLVVVTLVTGTILTVPLELAPRADPRRDDPPEQTAPLLDPVEATLALRAIDPPIAMHEIRSTTGSPLPARWRTAALTTYDGQRWAPDVVLRPIGRRLGSADPDALEFTVRFLDDDLSLVPLPGPPVLVEAPIETDVDRTLVRLTERPGAATLIPVVANPAPTAADPLTVTVATRPIDESVRGLTDLAQSIAGDGSVFDRLRRIEQTMRDEFELDRDVPGGGIQRALIERFLRDTNRGNEEQFVTSFVLLARALGVDARVATGFRTDVGGASPDVQLRSSDAQIWPEIRLVDGGWLAFDPVPEREASDVSEAAVEPQLQTPAAPQPPIAPPPDPSDDTPTTDEAAGDDTAGPLSGAVVWVVRGAAALGLLLVPVLLVTAAILGVKRRRRSRRLRAPTPEGRIRGSWAVATDALVDAGLEIGASATDREIADDALPLTPTAAPELYRLATLSSAVTFGSPPRPDLLADDALGCLDRVERSVGSAMTRWQRVRWRLSPRSLRRSTRSPVDR